MRIFETRSSLKIFYFLIAIDGNIDESEQGFFREIGLKLDPGHFNDYSGDIEKECEMVLLNDEDDRYDIILESVDDELTHKAGSEDQGLTPRLLVWDLIAAAFSNGYYDASEKRLILHVARKTGVEKSVVLEMEQMMKTSDAVRDELNLIQGSGRPYNEVRPVVDELESRLEVIRKSAEHLIEDEVDADNPYEYKPDFFDKTRSKLDKSVKPVTDKIGAAVKPVSEKVGQAVKPVADRAGAAVSPVAHRIGEGAKKTVDAASQKLNPVASKAKEKTGEVFGRVTMKFKRSGISEGEEN